MGINVNYDNNPRETMKQTVLDIPRPSVLTGITREMNMDHDRREMRATTKQFNVVKNFLSNPTFPVTEGVQDLKEVDRNLDIRRQHIDDSNYLYAAKGPQGISKFRESINKTGKKKVFSSTPNAGGDFKQGKIGISRKGKKIKKQNEVASLFPSSYIEHGIEHKHIIQDRKTNKQSSDRFNERLNFDIQLPNNELVLPLPS